MSPLKAELGRLSTRPMIWATSRICRPFAAPRVNMPFLSIIKGELRPPTARAIELIAASKLWVSASDSGSPVATDLMRELVRGFKTGWSSGCESCAASAAGFGLWFLLPDGKGLKSIFPGSGAVQDASGSGIGAQFSFGRGVTLAEET